MMLGSDKDCLENEEGGVIRSDRADFRQGGQVAS